MNDDNFVVSTGLSRRLGRAEGRLGRIVLREDVGRTSTSTLWLYFASCGDTLFRLTREMRRYSSRNPVSICPNYRRCTINSHSKSMNSHPTIGVLVRASSTPTHSPAALTSARAAASLMPHSDIFSRPGFPTPECMVIVDSGFSFTHVVPIMSGSVVWNAVKR